MPARDEFYDALETRAPESREAENFQALKTQLANAKANSRFFAGRLEGVDPEAVGDRAALAQVPVTRKPELAAAQRAEPPFGGIPTIALAEMGHVFMSPGPIFEPGGRDDHYGRYARALWAAGARPGELVYNTYSYHLTPAAMLVEIGAHAMGCPVFPGGIGNTELQVQSIATLKPPVYSGTPSFLRILLEKGDELGLDTSSLKKGVVGAEALLPPVRKMLSERGLEVCNSYGTADLGLVAFESTARDGMIVNEGCILELIEPGGSRPVAAGEVGEVTVTTFNPVYPLIRYATGDLSAALPGLSPCGRTNMRIKGWMGRADLSAKVRGMFVHPSNVADVVRRHPEIAKARLVIDNRGGRDSMVLRFAVTAPAEGLEAAVAESLQTVLKLRGAAEIVDAAALPDDGKIIDDIRKFD